MARPIKETPTLKGKDARIFEQRIKNPQSVSHAEIKAARDIYKSVMSKANFTF